MGKYKQLSTNILLMTAGSFASKLLTFFLVPLYTLVLSTEEYGVADIISTTIVLIAPLFNLQISEALLRFLLDRNANKDEVISCGAGVSVIGFALFLLLSPIILLFDQIRDFYLLFIIYYLTSTVYTFVSQAAKGTNHIKAYSFAGILNTALVVVPNLVLLLVFNLGVRGYIVSFIIGHVVASTYLILRTKIYHSLGKSFHVNKSTLRKMLWYSIPMIPNSISWWITNSSDKYMLSFIVGASDVGVYAIAYKIPSLLSTISGIFMSAWQISSVENFGSKENTLFFSDTYIKLASLNILVVAFLIAFAKPIASILFAKDFYVAWNYAIVLVLAYLFSSLSAFLGSIYTASKRTTALFYTSAIGAILNICLNLFLIPLMGTMGAAISTLLTYVIIWCIRMVHTKKYVVLEVDKLSNLASWCVLGVMVLVVYFSFSYYWIVIILCITSVCLLNRGFIITMYWTILNTLKKHS
jgi:O-antigen/teichoic acid export membrane protein